MNPDLVYPVKTLTGRVRTAPRDQIDREMQQGRLRRGSGNFEYYVEEVQPELELESAITDVEEPQPDLQTYDTRDMVATPGRRRRRRHAQKDSDE